MISAKARRLIIAVVATLGIAPMYPTAAYMVIRGRGAEVYSNVYGMLIHWTSVVVLLAVGVGYGVDLLIRWWQLRQWRRLEQQIANRSRPRT